MAAPCSHQDLGADPHRALHPPLDPHHAFCLQIADHRHVAGDDGERYLIGPPPLELVALLVTRCIGEDPHQPPCLTMVLGSSEVPPCRISKWRCGAVDRPLFPLRPMTSPALDVLAVCHDDARKVSVHRLVSFRVIEQDEQSVLRVLAHLVDGGAPRRPDLRPDGHRDVQPGVRLVLPGCAESGPDPGSRSPDSKRGHSWGTVGPGPGGLGSPPTLARSAGSERELRGGRKRIADDVRADHAAAVARTAFPHCRAPAESSRTIEFSASSRATFRSSPGTRAAARTTGK